MAEGLAAGGTAALAAEDDEDEAAEEQEEAAACAFLPLVAGLAAQLCGRCFPAAASPAPPAAGGARGGRPVGWRGALGAGACLAPDGPLAAKLQEGEGRGSVCG